MPDLPVKVVPFTDENLRAALPSPKRPRDQCSICTAIGTYASRTERVGDAPPPPLPEAVRQLREFMRLGENVATNWLECCPECDGLFYAERSHEFLIGGSEDCESHAQVTHDQVLALAEVSWAREPGVELHAFADGTWAIIREPGKGRRQRRA